MLYLAALAFVVGFGENQPWLDEWAFVPVLFGTDAWEPWLWQQHNEHRFPLPRLLFYTLFRLTDDFRTGMIVLVVGNALLALLLIRVAQHLRGRLHWADSFFPISLLHWGHYENFLMGYQVVFQVHLVLVVLLLLAILGTTPRNRFWRGLLVGGLTLLTVLSGAGGLGYGPPMACWLLLLAFAEFRAGRSWRGSLLTGLALLPVLYLAIYFHAYTKPAHHPPSAGLWPSLQIASQALGMAWGPSSEYLWPALAVATFAGGLLLVGGLLHHFRRGAEHWPSACGLLLHLAATAGVLFVLGWSRSGLDRYGEQEGYTMGFWSRYAFLSWPWLAWAYLVCLKFGSSRMQTWGPIGLAVVVAGLLPVNLGIGWSHGEERQRFLQALLHECREGVPLEVMLCEPHPLGQIGEPTAVKRRAVAILRQVGFGDFRFVVLDANASEPGAVPEPLAGSYRPVPSAFWWAWLVLPLVLLGRWCERTFHEILAERARELFRLQTARLEQRFFEKAAASGIPRGLRWQAISFVGEPILARQRLGGQLLAFVPLIIQFSAIPGSDMEDLPAVAEAKSATAVFFLEDGHWETSGRTLFNLTPREVLQHYAHECEALEFSTP